MISLTCYIAFVFSECCSECMNTGPEHTSAQGSEASTLATQQPQTKWIARQTVERPAHIHATTVLTTGGKPPVTFSACVQPDQVKFHVAPSHWARVIAGGCDSECHCRSATTSLPQQGVDEIPSNLQDMAQPVLPTPMNPSILRRLRTCCCRHTVKPPPATLSRSHPC